MAYIDETYYNEIFCGSKIPSDEFGRLARIASDIIDGIVKKPIDTITGGVKNACAYQLEMLYQQGGIDAISGSASGSSLSESLGDYSISAGTTANAGSKSMLKSMLMLNGVPISTIAISLLRREGLMGACFYDGRLYPR